MDNGIQEIEIDDLTYTYPQDSNQLLKVTDATLHPSGFEDDSTDGTLATDTTDDYTYDALGNMVIDENKGIQEIKYNHLNLPTYIDLGGKGNILYIYDATGRKVRKFVQDDVLTQNKQVDYADGFQYENNILQFFPTAEGYASRLTTKIEQSGKLIKIPIEELPEDQFNYVYNYTDHLGNIRLSYSHDPDTQQLKIVEQNHYYPFGMRHTNYSGGKMVMVKDEELKRMAPATEEFLTYKYKYNGKEWQDELGLNFYDYGARNYDAALGRWMNVDPLAEISHKLTPYNYVKNNPLKLTDPSGMIWKDQREADNLKKEINRTINSISKSLAEDQQRLSEEGISDKDKDNINNRINDYKLRLKSLDNTLNDIVALEKDQENTFDLVYGSDGRNYVFKGSDGVINIQGPDSALQIHELAHVSLSKNNPKGMLFDKDGLLLANYKDGLVDEIIGYRAQYAFLPNSLPSSVSSMNEIDLVFLASIRDENNAPVYEVLYQQYQEQIKARKEERKREAKKEKENE